MNEWQPIETAPKDGTKLDIYVETLEERYCDAYYDTEDSSWCWDIAGTGKRIVFSATPPTHWMPLPEPPQVERRNALAEGADGRHDCLQSTQPKYTRNTLEDVTKLWNTRVTVEELLIQFQCYVYNTPIGAEDIRLGKSYYNWGKHYLDVLQGIAGLDIKRESRVTAPPQQNPTSVHKYTREELVEIMCRANADLSPVGSDALVYFSMDDCATGTPSPNWHRDLHKMHTALSALIEAGALQVKQTELHNDADLQGKI